MKFLADCMLGKLTRWLRILGYDVKYLNNAEDKELVEIALKGRRVLLTRDYDLSNRARALGAESFCIKGVDEIDELFEMKEEFKIELDVDTDNSRCPKCNAEIAAVPKDKVENRIPESTARFYNEFWICADCDQIYWQGSHWKRILETLNKVKNKIETSMIENV